MSSADTYQATVPARRQHFDVRGIEYCVHEWGDEEAPLLFFLHGWADSGATFQFVVDCFESAWHVVAPDWRGFGRSAASPAPYWFPDYLADLHRLLEHYSPDAPVRLVGHSMGGNVASLYAGAMPERIQALVNIEGFGLADSRPEDAPSRYREWLLAQDEVPGFSCYPDFSPLVRRIRSKNPGISAGRAQFVARQWAVEEEGAVHLCADPKHKLPNAVLYRRREAEACWRNITAELMLVSGEQSAFAETFANLDSSAFPEHEAVTIAGAGHMVHFEEPARLAAAIERFLKQDL